MLELLRNKNAVILWISRAVSRFGDAFETLALMYLVYDLTGSGIAMGTVMICNVLPNVIISPIAGVIIDRHNKKKIMIYAEILRAAAILTIPVLMYLNVIAFWHVCVIAVAVSIGESFFEPSYGIACKLLVKYENLIKLNSLSTTTNTIMRIIGYSTSTIIMMVVGKETLFIFDSFTFLFSGAAVLFLTLPKEDKKEKGSIDVIIKEFKEGAIYFFSKKIILILMLAIFIIQALSVPITSFIPILVEKVLKVDPSLAGTFLTISSIGSILGMVLLQFILKTKIKLSQIIGLTFLIMGGFSILPVYFGSEITGLALFFTMGLIGPIVSIVSFTRIQQSCDVEYLGRVGAFMNMSFLGSIPLVAGLTGWAIEVTGLGQVIMISAVLYIVTGIYIYFRIKKYDIEEVSETKEVTA